MQTFLLRTGMASAGGLHMYALRREANAGRLSFGWAFSGMSCIHGEEQA